MDDRKTKIAILEPIGGHGGMNYYDFGLLDGLRSVDMPAALYTCDKTSPPKNHIHYTHRFFKKIYGNSPKVLRFLRFTVGLSRSLMHARRNGVKLVHYHLFHYTLLEFFEIIIARFLGMRLVLTIHDVESFVSGSFLGVARFVLRNSDGIIVHNKLSRQSVLDILPETSNKIAVIPHGNYVQYASAAPSREEARKSLDISADSRVVLFFGQIKQVKGLDILLKAWKNIPAVVPHSVLLIAGKVWKDDLNIYSDLIKQSGIAESVHLDIRYIPDDEASTYYAAADLVVLPYRKIYQSGVLLMAMSHARAVLVSDLPGMTEIVENGVNGYVFRSDDVESLSNELIHALQDAGKREAIAETGFRTVSTEHDWCKIGSKTKGFYEKICTNLAGAS